MAKTRIDFLTVPLDIVSQADLGDEFMKVVHSRENSQICFVSIWDILKARSNPEYLNCLKEAALVLPTSKSIIKGLSFLKYPQVARYNPFPTIIHLLGELDKNYASLYLLGGRKQVLLTSEKNLRKTFPYIHVVGRFVGYYPKSMETDIITAIKKTSPSLVLLSDGIKGRHLWFYRKRKQFNQGLFLYYKDAFRIFSKRKKRVSNATFEKGFEMWYEIIRNPLKVFLIFPYIGYLVILLWYRCFKIHRK
ncbi:MAG TPA: WecB/TagA/CpsF family glycosyltransferase [Treponemataceae bacterium]|nr:WecB/TagA/CpsF family glycosyltransferase [Treponemataceae bacterium]